MLPTLKPLPQPHIHWFDQFINPMTRVWREYIESFDRLLRALKGIEASFTFDPPSLASGAGSETTLTVFGAALGDFVLASFSQPLSGVTISAWVSAVDTVSVRFQNNTGATVDLASGTLAIRLIKA